MPPLEITACVTDATTRLAPGADNGHSPTEHPVPRRPPRRRLAERLLLPPTRMTPSSATASRSAPTARDDKIVPRVLPSTRRGVGTGCCTGSPPRRRARPADGPHQRRRRASRLFASASASSRSTARSSRRTSSARRPTCAATPAGVEIVTAQDHPGLSEGCFEGFGREALAGFSVDTPLDVSLERWTRDWLGDPMFLALHDGEVVGCAGSASTPTTRPAPENSLTAVRGDWRRRGLAVHLKQRTMRLGGRARRHRDLHVDPGRQRRDALAQHPPGLRHHAHRHPGRPRAAAGLSPSPATPVAVSVEDVTRLVRLRPSSSPLALAPRRPGRCTCPEPDRRRGYGARFRLPGLQISAPSCRGLRPPVKRPAAPADSADRAPSTTAPA